VRQSFHVVCAAIGYAGRMRRAFGLVLIASCGRVGFDGLAGVDGSPGGDAGATAALVVGTTGAGTGSIHASGGTLDQDCTGPCTLVVPPGTTLHLVANAATGSWLRGWTSTCYGRGPCDVVVDHDLSITAEFTPEPNHVFVTSTAHDGAFGGLAGADAVCKSLGGPAYVALLSSSTLDWATRLGTARGFIRPDGVPVADLANQLGSGELWSEIAVDETGARSTGSFFDTPSASTNCADWTTNSGATTSTVALFDFGHALADYAATMFCSMPNKLVCVETDRVVPVVPIPQPNRRVFFSAGIWTTSSGIGQADALCAGEATSAGLSGSFHALLATNGASPISRFDVLGAPWMRADGITLAPDWVTSGDFGIDLSMDATGTVGAIAATATIGATAFDAAGDAGATCNNWTATSGMTTTIGANVNYSTDLGTTTLSCGQDIHVLCFQD